MSPRDKVDRNRFLKWLDGETRYHHEAASKWGHIYEWAVSDDLVSLGETEVFMNGRCRDIRRPIFRRIAEAPPPHA